MIYVGFKFHFTQCLGEDINRLIARFDVAYLYNAIIYSLSGKVLIYFKMFGFVMKNSAFGDFNTTLVVTP